MFKRLLALFLVICCVLTFVGCSKPNGKENYYYDVYQENDFLNGYSEYRESRYTDYDGLEYDAEDAYEDEGYIDYYYNKYDERYDRIWY